MSTTICLLPLGFSDLPPAPFHARPDVCFSCLDFSETNWIFLGKKIPISTYFSGFILVHTYKLEGNSITTQMQLPIFLGTYLGHLGVLNPFFANIICLVVINCSKNISKKNIIGQNVRFFIANQIKLSKMQKLVPCKN